MQAITFLSNIVQAIIYKWNTLQVVLWSYYLLNNSIQAINIFK